jgi:hypothetical protein
VLFGHQSRARCAQNCVGDSSGLDHTLSGQDSLRKTDKGGGVDHGKTSCWDVCGRYFVLLRWGGDALEDSMTKTCAAARRTGPRPRLKR